MDNLQKINSGSKLFVNAQCVYKLLALLSQYYDGKCTLEMLFKFIRTIQKQRKVKLYKELKIELDEFMYLKQFLKENPDDTKAVKYTVDRLVENIIQGRI